MKIGSEVLPWLVSICAGIVLSEATIDLFDKDRLRGAIPAVYECETQSGSVAENANSGLPDSYDSLESFALGWLRSNYPNIVLSNCAPILPDTNGQLIVDLNPGDLDFTFTDSEGNDLVVIVPEAVANGSLPSGINA